MTYMPSCPLKLDVVAEPGPQVTETPFTAAPSTVTSPTIVALSSVCASAADIAKHVKTIVPNNMQGIIINIRFDFSM
ncbi:hypothetical protein CUJ83_12845 [Methanocella sp. CWC-04]|uniref:Uncharacterized protein n=1 Tax=Methanooceanicella nereidis TaxID=2052831 RepID=A0AAP2REK4_9EURY|nr:hypothetical protein [Methanocella sp. CWC-04]